MLFDLCHLLPRHIGEWIIAWRSAIGIQSDNHTGEVSVVWRRTAKLVIGLARAEGAARQVLELTATTVVADLDVDLAVGAEEDLARVVVTPQRLARVNRVRVVLLEGAERDQIPVECQRIVCRIEDEAIDPVPQRFRRSRWEGRVRVTDLSQIA